jgi:hypothetical protein
MALTFTGGTSVVKVISYICCVKRYGILFLLLIVMAALPLQMLLGPYWLNQKATTALLVDDNNDGQESKAAEEKDPVFCASDACRYMPPNIPSVLAQYTVPADKIINRSGGDVPTPPPDLLG